MRPHVPLLVLSAVLLGGGPPTQPTIDLSTPLHAVESWARAMETGNVAEVRKVGIGTAETYELMTPMIRVQGAARKMTDAAVARFGNAGNNVTSPAAPLPTQLKAKLTETIIGDTASVGPEHEGGIKLKNTPDGWKIDFQATASPDFRERATKMAPLYADMEKTLLGSAALIASGQYKTADEARNHLQDALGELVSQFQRKNP